MAQLLQHSKLTFSLFFLIQLFFNASLFSQIDLSFPTQPQDVDVCEADSLNFFDISFTEATNVDAITIRMPAGIHYVAGSVHVISSTGGLSLSEADISDPVRPVFELSGSAEAGSNISFSISRRGLCDAVVFSQDGNLAHDTLAVWSGTTLLADSVSLNYNINYASLFTSYVHNSDTIVNDLPSMVCRDLEIINGGTGYTSRIQHQVTPGTDLQNYELRYQGSVLTPVSTDGGIWTYELDLTAPPFAGTFGVEDTILQNGESIVLEECFSVTSCDFSDGSVRHQSSWGCGDELCQMGNVVMGNVDLLFSQPALRSAIDYRDNIVCMDGTDQGYIRMKVWNEGIGPSVLNRIALRANGANTSLDIDGFSIVDTDDNDLSSYFPVGSVVANNGCGSGVIEYTLESSDFESSYQLYPGDSVTIVMQYILCCPDPESCGPYTISNPFVELRGTDLCGQNSQTQRADAGTGGTASASNPIISGMSVLAGGDVTEICAEYPNYQFLNAGNPDSSYVTLKVELPDGLAFNNAMTTSSITIGGTTIPIQDIVEDGDVLYIHALQSDVENVEVAPIKVCFEVMAVCGDGPGGLTSLTLGQSTSIHCDPLCLINLNCSSHDILLLGCNPGDCDITGGGYIDSYEVERISYGYVDAGGDRNWDDFVRADAADVNVKRAMIGDTIRHSSVLGFTNGTTMSWSGGIYRETYTASWDEMLCVDRAWVEITSGGNTYEITGLVPTAVQNGFEYDLSVSALSVLPGGNALPMGFTFTEGDEIHLYTQYAFCKENAPQWFSVEPGVYRPEREQQNVIFTGRFEATPSGGGAPIGCNEAYDEMLFLGASLSVAIMDGGFTGSGCDMDFRYRIDIEQNIGGVLSGYSGTFDFFPNEFRPLYIPDSIVISIPDDVTFKNAWLVTQQIANGPPPYGEEVNNDIPMALITETGTEVILRVRDVHDAFGGSPFVYDEENADLRYYISFQRSCESPRMVSSDISIAYTTPICPGDDFVTEVTGLSTGTNSDLYNINYAQLPVSQMANNDNTCYELHIRPGGNLAYTWLVFPENDSVTILSVSEGGTVLTPDASGMYLLGAHNGNTTRVITICADLNTCNTGIFEVSHGWSCIGYPDDMNAETCTYETLAYTIETVQSELQFNLITQPSNSNPDNRPDFCAPLLYELLVNSANAGSVINPRIAMNVPVGFEIENITAQYPNGTTAQMMPFTTSGDTIIVDLADHPAMVNDSLPGTATDVTVANRQVRIQIHGRTNCDFRSGSQLFFTSYGERPCGGPVLGNGIRRASERLYINGVTPYQVDPTVEIDAEQGVTCSVGTPVHVSYQVEGGDFTGLDSGVVILSPGLEFVPGSLICNSTNSAACPVIDRIVEDPDQPGGSRVYYSFEGSVLTDGETIDFTFEVKAQESTTCGQTVNIQLENFVTVTGLSCEGVECTDGVTGITGVDTLEMEVIHPVLDFTNLVGNTVAGTDYLEYMGSVTVDQRALSEGDSLYVYIYCADTEGMATDVVDSILISGPVAICGTIDFTGYLEQMSCVLENGLVFSVRPIEGCLCSDPLGFLPGDEIMEVSREFDLALIKTVDQPVDLSYGDTLTFNIQVINQGDLWADSFEIADYIPAGLAYLDTNDLFGWNFDMAGTAKRWVDGPLLPGADTTIQIYLRLDYNAAPDAYLNYAEISQDENPIDEEDIDSTPDDDPSDDGGGEPESPSDDSVDGDGSGDPGDEDPDTDEDDHDPALVQVADLALRKVMSEGTPGPYVYGDTLVMNIQLFNQGNIPSGHIEVTDYLPAGFTFIDDASINPGWDGSDPSNPVYTWTGDVLSPGDSTDIAIQVILSMAETPDSASWTNFSEISYFEDTTGMELQDVDSEPDNDPSNDPGGQPDSPADNYVNGDGSGDPGDGIPESDEDDHDPLRVEVYDLALRKVVNTENDLPFAYNDTAIFDIIIFNQGNEPAQNIEVTDYVPTNTDFAEMHAVNVGWDATDPSNPVFTIPGPLLPGADTTISIALILRQEAGVNNWINYAEISAFEDLEGGTPEDIDSDPDNSNDDYGANPLGETDDEINGNGKAPGTPDGDDDPLFDEDDHDVAILDVVDLALIKVIDSLNSEFPLQFGNLLKFDIIIENQGNVIADSVRVQDYVPPGFGFDPGLQANIDEGWQADGSVLLEKRLDFLERDTVSIYLMLQSVADPQMDSWFNYAEIMEVYDTTGMEVGELDYDSSPGSDTEEEREVHPGDDGDDDFMSPDRDSLGSEDDHDPAGVMFLDLALYKQVDSAALDLPLAYGDTIKFDIMVINQEGIMADSVLVGDYVPEGYHFDPDNPDNQALGWTADTTIMLHGPVNVGDTVTTSIYLELLPNSVPTDRTWVNYAEILEVWTMGMEMGSMDIDSEPGSNTPEENEVYPHHPGDDDTESNYRDSTGSEDDHDPAFVEVFDLALIKTTEEEVAYPTLDVPFDITVINQGGIPATNIEVSDYIPIGFTFDPGLNPGWSGADPLVTYTIPDTLLPGESSQVTIVLSVTEEIAPENLINVAEISAAQDTTGQDREDIDGVFDDDPGNDPGGQPDSPADNYVDGDGSGTPGDGNSGTDEDNQDPAKILPCLDVNCHGYINLAFGTECEIEVTPAMLLVDKRLAEVAPQFYEVELFYGPGIRIPDNILRPEHVGRTITARVTFLLDECGGGTCESTIVLDKPNACIIQNTLDTAVYCTDPFLQLDPLDPAYPKPELLNVCSAGELTLEVSPDWVMTFDCNENSDTAEIIFREWTAVTAGGARCSGVDTIVVYRLPKLTPESFVGTAEETFYCDLLPVLDSDGGLIQFASWKQPVGLHDYELPYTRLRGLTYAIPSSVILAGLEQAEALGGKARQDYLDQVILRKLSGEEVTIGDIVSGDYMRDLIAKATNDQKTYGFLQALIELNENPVQFVLETEYEFYPYLLLEAGDWILSEGGYFEEVELEWFFNGNGNSPFWFAGGWPMIPEGGTGHCTSYHDAGAGQEFDCIRVRVPAIDSAGLNPDSCITICLTVLGTHCGITIEREEFLWSGSCPQSRGMDVRIRQTCWAETVSNCVDPEQPVDTDIVASYDSTAKGVDIHLSQWQTLIDTIGPIFDFCYPLEDCDESPQPGVILTRASDNGLQECGDLDWCEDDIVASIRAGEQYASARAWEQCHPTQYSVSSHDCGAVIFVPDVRVIDNCSDVHSVKASIDVLGGLRTVALERTATSIQVLPNGDTSYIYTYSHTNNPIRIPFQDCDGAPIEVRYEAADQCWNQSTWSKFIQVTDNTPPTVVVNHGVNVSLDNKTAWVQSTTFNEGSWDNCSIGLELVRRTGWASNTALVDLCNGAGMAETYTNWIDLLVDLGVSHSQLQIAANGGVVGDDDFNAQYDVDKLRNVLQGGEIADHYFKEVVWLWTDAEDCGQKVVHGWLYELAAYIGLECGPNVDEHGNPLRISELQRLFDYLIGQPGYGQEMAYLGGGWASDVPFVCTDACQSPEVELLVMDQCCNFGIGSTTVEVNDQGSAEVVRKLPDLEISCEAYNLFYSEIVDAAADLGTAGSSADSAGVFDALDRAFGTYVLTWVDNQNRPVDLNGQLLSESALNFDYRNVNCFEKTETEQVAVPTHDNQVEWVNRTTATTYLDTTDHHSVNGIVAINCSGERVQDIWVDLDECGNGTITRRFFITGGCSSGATPLQVEQVIRVQSACTLRESMFDLPEDIGSTESPICISGSITESNFPDTLGVVTMKPHLAGRLCTTVTYGKVVKELNILDTDMKKYQITWTVKDWCDGVSGAGEFTYTQEVVAVIDPGCELNGGESNGRNIPERAVGGEQVFRDQFVLYQNRPNPVEGYTVIGFELPQSADAKLTIYDVTGRLIHEIRGSYEKGYNEVEISGDVLSVTGVLFYQLDTDKYTATKRMVIN